MSTQTATERGKQAPKTTLIDVSLVSEIKELGFRAEKLDKDWTASEIKGDRKIGPARSLKALATQVKLELGVTGDNGKGKVAKSENENPKPPEPETSEEDKK